MAGRANVLYLSHGGGPLPLLGDPGHSQMVDCLQRIAETLPRPDAILVVSAHWEAAIASVTRAAQPDLIYDYYGFPEEAYRITYPCPGEPGLASRVAGALAQAGLAVSEEPDRGLDHGVYVPLKIMYPEADIPCVQLSLLHSLDAEAHLQMGEALSSLTNENLLIIGSGFSFHNMRAFFAQPTPETENLNQQFEQWLQATCTAPMSEGERRQRLAGWELAPGARFCHPREEHLLPLHVCYGIAGRACDEAYPLTILDRRASMYLWRHDKAAD